MPMCIVTNMSVSVPDSEKRSGANNHFSAFPSLPFNRLVYCVNSILEFTRYFTLTFDISLFLNQRLAANTFHIEPMKWGSWNLFDFLLHFLNSPCLLIKASCQGHFSVSESPQKKPFTDMTHDTVLSDLTYCIHMKS